MGTILTSYGDPGYDHEGYAAYVLDDGTLIGTWGTDTRPRMTGELVAACSCGWTGATRYPGADSDPLDEEAEAIALGEWEHTHARPVLERAWHGEFGQLQATLRNLAAMDLTSEGRSPRERVQQLARLRAALRRTSDVAQRLYEQAWQQDDRERPQ